MTEILAQAAPGEERSMKALLPLVYNELRALASSYLQRGGNGHTLQPTALVHEAFIKMVGNDKGWSGREHFMAVAATAMRHVLVDHSRAKKSDKRGAGAARSDLTIVDASENSHQSRELRVLELDDLLTQLAKADPRAARIAEMRLFGGMDQDQIARVLGLSRMTISTDWQFARAWLATRIRNDAEEREVSRG